MRILRFACALLALVAAPALAIDIDGKIDPTEWQGARHITDFRQTQPLSGKPARKKSKTHCFAIGQASLTISTRTQPQSRPPPGEGSAA